MAIQTFNTQQSDSGWNPQSYNPFPGYKPYNPFATGPVYKAKDVTRPVQQQAPRNAFGANWTYDAAGNPVYQPAQRRPTQPAYNQNLLPLPVVTRQSIAAGQQQQALRRQQQQQLFMRQFAPTTVPNRFANPGMTGMIYGANGLPRGYIETGGGYVPYGPLRFNRTTPSGVPGMVYDENGVARGYDNDYDPSDSSASPYMSSQYIPATEYNYDYGNSGGYGGWGGWGGGGGYEHQDSAAFYQGNYTQRRNRWNETLLTWGLRQQ